MLWSNILFLSCCTIIVTAQSAPPMANDTCSYARLGTTVSQFCYTTLLNRFAYKRLNFTIVTTGLPNTGAALEFEPLIDNHQVDVEVVDDSDGLKAWASLANSLVDSVLDGGLPYGKVIISVNIIYGGAGRSGCGMCNGLKQHIACMYTHTCMIHEFNYNHIVTGMVS